MKHVVSFNNNWFCDVCGVEVPQEIDIRTRIIQPISNYWNVEKDVVYCSPQCSVIGHGENNDNPK